MKSQRRLLAPSTVAKQTCLVCRQSTPAKGVRKNFTSSGEKESKGPDQKCSKNWCKIVFFLFNHCFGKSQVLHNLILYTKIAIASSKNEMSNSFWLEALIITSIIVEWLQLF